MDAEHGNDLQYELPYPLSYVSFLTAILSVCQFHLLFYLSRPLPNTFALGIVCVGVAYLLEVNVCSFFYGAHMYARTSNSLFSYLNTLFFYPFHHREN